MNNCVFCRIVRGEIPATRVYEDEHTLAFLDVQPVHPGHTLVVSKSTAACNLLDISAADWRSLAQTVWRVARAVEHASGAGGVNILMNNRPVAGQVVNHAHVHVIPRFEGDGLEHWRKLATTKEEMAAMGEKIRVALKN